MVYFDSYVQDKKGPYVEYLIEKEQCYGKENIQKLQLWVLLVTLSSLVLIFTLQ